MKKRRRKELPVVSEVESHIVNSSLPELLARPGMLVRRLHQVYLSIYAEECSAFKVTPVQQAIMAVIQAKPGLEQGRVALEVGVDRTTMADVTRRLEKRSYVERSHDPADRRTRRLHLTPAGQAILADMAAAVERVHARLLEPVPAAERDGLLDCLVSLVSAHNEDGRVPMRLR